MSEMWRLLRPDAVMALEDPKILSSMPRYVGILKGRFLPRFMVSRYVPVNWDLESSEGELWELHNRSLVEMESLMRDLDSGKIGHKEIGEPPERSLLHLKAKIGESLMAPCRLCERRCGADRLRGELGFCRVGREFKAHSCFDHMGEEPEVVPSFTVYG
ncbi:MAG: hypothetical protein H5T33_07040 [Candidatus Methanosuratus sp.]|nr:hypothetical protein [Candidatus Methanosuratincola sp.]